MQVKLAHPGEHHFLGLRVVLQVDGLSSSVILWSAPESLVSSPRALGVTARPTIGVGNLIGGISSSPSVMPVWSSSFLAMATMSPGPASSMFGVLSACTESSGPILMPLRRAVRRDRRIFLQRAGVDADEAQPLNERVDPRLEHLGGQRRGSDRPLSVTVSPSLVAVRVTAVGGSEHWTSTSSNSSMPTPILVEMQTIGVRVPCRTASTQSRSSSSFDRHFAFEVLLHHRLVGLDDRLDDRLAELGRIEERTAWCHWARRAC